MLTDIARRNISEFLDSKHEQSRYVSNQILLKGGRLSEIRQTSKHVDWLSDN